MSTPRTAPAEELAELNRRAHAHAAWVVRFRKARTDGHSLEAAVLIADRSSKALS